MSSQLQYITRSALSTTTTAIYQSLGALYNYNNNISVVRRSLQLQLQYITRSALSTTTATIYQSFGELSFETIFCYSNSGNFILSELPRVIEVQCDNRLGYWVTNSMSDSVTEWVIDSSFNVVAFSLLQAGEMEVSNPLFQANNNPGQKMAASPTNSHDSTGSAASGGTATP